MFVCCFSISWSLGDLPSSRCIVSTVLTLFVRSQGSKDTLKPGATSFLPTSWSIFPLQDSQSENPAAGCSCRLGDRHFFKKDRYLLFIDRNLFLAGLSMPNRCVCVNRIVNTACCVGWTWLYNRFCRTLYFH